MSKIDELKFDDKNFNKHTEYGMSLLEKSLRENGAGRSILIDKDNNIIAGNGIIEAAGQVGLEKVKIVETTGDEIVAVKRTDVSLDSEQGRTMALADNATASADLEWDKESIQEEAAKWGINADDWGVDIMGFDIDEVVEEASLGTIQEYSDDVEYNLKNLFREKVSSDIEEKIAKGVEQGQIRTEVQEILECRAKQCSIFNFDEIIKFYRSGDASEIEKELLRRLYLVFITPKEALEEQILNVERVTGEIYDKNLTEENYED